MAADPTKFAEVTLSVEQLQVAIQACDEAIFHARFRADVDLQIQALRRTFTLALQDCQRRAEKRATNIARQESR